MGQLDNFVTFDIETGGLDKETILARSKAFEVPGNVSKQETIDAKREEYYQKVVDDAALHAETGRVLTVGFRGPGLWKLDTSPGLHTMTHMYQRKRYWIYEGDDEAELLTETWHIVNQVIGSGRRLVGFYIHDFDLPFLVRRSWYLGVPVPSYLIDKDRYWNTSFIDLHRKWALGDYRAHITLHRLLLCCGLPGKTESGADFASKWINDRPEAVRYLRRDLDRNWDIGVCMGVIDRGQEESGSNVQEVLAF